MNAHTLEKCQAAWKRNNSRVDRLQRKIRACFSQLEAMPDEQINSEAWYGIEDRLRLLERIRRHADRFMIRLSQLQLERLQALCVSGGA